MLKDEVLKELSMYWDVANFISYSKDGEFRFSSLGDKEVSIAELLRRSGKVNVRSFSDCKDRKRTNFVMGLESVEEVESVIVENCQAGLYSIVNEFIDPSDGGVSGVVTGDIIEIVAKGTPRDVEDGEKVLTLEKSFGIKILELYYGVELEKLKAIPRRARVEFTIDKKKRLIVWEESMVKSVVRFDKEEMLVNVNSSFVQMVSEKIFGLVYLVAKGIDIQGFYFENSLGEGRELGVSRKYSGEGVLVRTAPDKFSPGYYDGASYPGNGKSLGEVFEEEKEKVGEVRFFTQNKVKTKLARAVIFSGEEVLVETAESGEDLMMGRVAPSSEEVPKEVMEKVEELRVQLYEPSKKNSEAVKIEFVVDEFGELLPVQLNFVPRQRREFEGEGVVFEVEGKSPKQLSEFIKHCKGLEEKGVPKEV